MTFKEFIKFHKWGTSGIIHNDLKWYVKNNEDVVYLAKYIIYRSDKLLNIRTNKKQYSCHQLVEEIDLLCAAIVCLLDFAPDSEMTFETVQCLIDGAANGITGVNSATDLLMDDYKNNLQHVMAWYCTQEKCTKDDLVGYLAEKDADSEMCSYIFEHGNFDFAEHEQTKAENSESDDEFDFPSDIDYSSI